MSNGPGAAEAAITEALAPSDYVTVLEGYIRNLDEQALYTASLLSEACIRAGFGPEDIVALHFESLQQVLSKYAYREQTRVMGDGHQFLLEVMIAYGVRYKEYLELKLSQGLRDAENRIQLERERAVEAERITAEKQDLLTLIAHELRTPTTAVKGFVEVAQRQLSAGKTEAASGSLSSARQAVERLSRMTADLSEAVRNGPTKLIMSEIDLGEVIGQACAWAGASAASKGLTISIQSSSDTQRVVANADALLTILGNLLANAVRYTPPGGQIVVRRTREGQLVSIEVADTGIGIAEDQVEAIFQKFYRAPEARQLEAQGLGLGLSLVRQLLDAHGGSIHVESRPGAGSVFRVTLPVDATQAQEAEEPNG